MHRVQKLLSNYGYCSRRKAEELIKAGRVKVNNKLITIGDKAEDEDDIYVDDKLVKKEDKIYLIFNKPLNCVTALKDKQYKTIMDYIHIKERVFPVGRLDYNTSGLLILTNDGDFANKIAHPRYETTKTYIAGLDRPLKQEHIRILERGIQIAGRKTQAQIKKLKSNVIEIQIHEGRNRIIRRIFKELGFRVKSLQRIKIGKLSLGNLKPGTYRELTEKERKLF